MKEGDCVVIYKHQDVFKCILDGKEFSMTHEQLNTLRNLYDQANNIFALEANLDIKIAYVSDNDEIKILYN